MQKKWEEIADRIWTVILSKVTELKNSGLTLDKIGEMIGLENDNRRSVVSNWLKGRRQAKKTDFVHLMTYLEKLGIDFGQFLNLPAVPTTVINSIDIESNDLPKVPVIGEVGAGTPADLFNIDPEYMLPVPKEYYKNGMVLLRVVGDSMSPTIPDGAYIGIIQNYGTLIEGKIYLVNCPPFGRVVKRVQLNENCQIVLISDNPNYSPITVPDEGYERVILGKVCLVLYAM